VIDEQRADVVRLALTRMAEGEPLSRIVGHREFWGLEFALSADTLDPRPETETVVEAVLRRVSDRCAPLRFIDLGTGTGCILLALLSEFPAATGLGVDVALGAAMTARSNAAALGLAERARFFVGDWGTAISGWFDAIVSNPPYIAGVALADLPDEVAARVYESMKQSFAKTANRLRGEGQQASATIRAAAERQRTVILADAERDALRTRGEGDAVAAQTYARAYSRNPEFYAFYRSMQAYDRALGKEGDLLVVTPDGEFFQYLKDASPTAKPHR